MSTLDIKIRFFFHCLRKQIKSWLLRLVCYFFSSWYYFEINCIGTTGNVLKLNSLFTYQENGFVNIERGTNVHIERGYLYCSLFIISKNEIITVRHTMQKVTHVLWRLKDKERIRWTNVQEIMVWSNQGWGSSGIWFLIYIFSKPSYIPIVYLLYLIRYNLVNYTCFYTR